MDNRNKILEETVVDGCRIFVENGEVKIILSKDIQQNGYMSLETAKQLTLEEMEKIMTLKQIKMKIVVSPIVQDKISNMWKKYTRQYDDKECIERFISDIFKKIDKIKYVFDHQKATKKWMGLYMIRFGLWYFAYKIVNDIIYVEDFFHE